MLRTGRTLALLALLATPAAAQTEIREWLGYGQSQPAQYGLHVRGIGDANGDGRPDVAIGGHLDDYDSATVDSGTVEIVSGATGLVLHSYFGTAGQMLGAGVAPAGDLDGDGRADFAINAYAEGRTRIHSGATGLVLQTFPAGATIFGPWAVDGGFDVDGDAAPDLLVGYPAGAPAGRVRLFSGATGALLRDWLNPGAITAAFGEAAVFLGDVDLDGVADVAVGARGENNYVGIVRVYSSATGAQLWSATGTTNSNFGVSLARLGDVDRDGFADLGVGANLAGGSAIGAAYVLSGANGTVLHAFTGALVGGQFGKSIAGPGDLDSDGYADIVVGAPHGSGPLALGHVHAFSGRTGSLLWDLPTTLQLDWFGAAVSWAGDLDGDGRLDVLVGAPRDALNPTCGGGPSCVYFGRVTAQTGCDGCPIVERFCAGDGTGTACPCGNSGSTGRGCANSSSSAGALLDHVGNARVSSDDLVLLASGLPPTASAYFFQGDARENGGLGSALGDGLLCATGALLRIGTRTAIAGAVSYPDASGGAPISARGQIPGSGATTRHYQALYRNAAAFCTPAAFNLTNGLTVTWVP